MFRTERSQEGMHDEQTAAQVACNHCNDGRSYRISARRPAQSALLFHADVREVDRAYHGVLADRMIPAYAQSEKISGAAVHVRRYYAADLLSVSAWKNAGERSRILAALECDVYAGDCFNRFAMNRSFQPRTETLRYEISCFIRQIV